MTRPSPTESATMYPVGTKRQGNNGWWWEVRASGTGVQRWIQTNLLGNKLPDAPPTTTTVDPNISQTLNHKPKMSKIKSITKKTTQEVRTIDTSLINKEEVFKMLALAESTGLPCLLVGEPGVAKTKTIIEYAKAWLK